MTAEIEEAVDWAISSYPEKVIRYKNGEKRFFGFFMGIILNRLDGKADAKIINKILLDKLSGYTPEKCANCGIREGTIKWVGESGWLGLTHGFWKMWCEVCATRVQLEYAKTNSKEIPELEEKLRKLEIDEVI